MKSVSNHLAVIKDKFPLLGERIDQLYDKDADFRDICSDYIDCMEASARFRQISREKEDCIKDYQMVLVELEKEIVDLIQ